MKMGDIKKMSNEELKGALEKIRFELQVEERKIASTGVASKKISRRAMRKSIARMLTVLRERGVKA
ncbi:MAG: 50S ribosomal protein L29 [Candidatus Micrarchaeaceae archaeon]